MPMYTYRCKECKDCIELIQSMSEGDAYLASGPRCKKCDGEIERIIQKTSFELKGMGWEKDGYM